MARPWLVMLNTTRMALAPRLFACIISSEIILSLIAIIGMPFVSQALYNARVAHRNMRLQYRIIATAVWISALARYVLLYYQLFDVPLDDNDWLLIIVDIARDASFGYLCGLIATYAMERTVATFFWEWYEQQPPSTLIPLVLIELCNILPAVCNSTGWLFGYWMFNINVVVLMFTVIHGAVLFFLTYLYNVRLLRKRSITVFTISKHFQIRENCAMMQILMRITMPAGSFSAVGFAFFCYYEWAPQEWELSRYISIALFDLFMALFFLFLMALTVNSDSEMQRQTNNLATIRKLRKILRMREPVYKPSRLKTSHVEPPNAAETTHSYFTQFKQSLESEGLSVL